MGNPNWLLSTIAQSAAALVAIIGGFLVSRVITLAAARGSVSHRLAVLDGELQSIDRASEAHTAHLVDLDASEFMDDAIGDLVAQPDVQVTELMRLGNPGSLTEEQLAPYVDAARVVIRSAYETLPKYLAQLGTIPYSLDEMKAEVKELRIEPDEQDLWEAVFRQIRRRLREEQKRRERERREEEAKRSPWPSLAHHIIPDFADDLVDIPVVRGTARPDARNATKEKLRALEIDRQFNEREREKVAEELAQLKQPKEVGVGIAVLSYFAIVGVLWPVLVLADLEPFHSSAWREWLVAGFASGLVGVIAFLFYAIRRMGGQ